MRRGRIAYVCEGSGTSEEEARINALSSVLYEIGDDVGRDAYSLYFRELESSGKVEDLDGSIRETYTREYRGGRFSCYVLFDMSEASLLSLRTPDLLVLLEAEEDVRNLLDEARSYYMENRDVDAISSALSALSISIEHELDEPEISPEGILSTLIYYTEPLEIRVRQFDGGIDASVSYFFGDSKTIGITAGISLYPQFLIFDDAGHTPFRIAAYGYAGMSFRFPASIIAMPAMLYLFD